MSLRASLMALVVAVFGLQAPLCAMACTTAPASVAGSIPDTPVVHETQASPHAPAHEMPCHGAKQSAPTRDSESHADCDCENMSPGAVQTGALSDGRAEANPAPPIHPTVARLVASVRSLPLAPEGAPGIPPPDILLLKSTFLI